MEERVDWMNGVMMSGCALFGQGDKSVSSSGGLMQLEQHCLYRTLRVQLGLDDTGCRTFGLWRA